MCHLSYGRRSDLAFCGFYKKMGERWLKYGGVLCLYWGIVPVVGAAMD
jgi:hypothetical protein